MEAVATQISLLKYEAYKDSGEAWIGEIPEHWETLANKYIFRLKKNEVGKRASEFTLLSLTLNGVIKRDMENPQGKFPVEFNTYQEVQKGDFVFCLFDVEETPRTVGLSPFDGMITGAYTVMEPFEGFSRKFLYYFYLNLDADKRLKPLYRGLRNTIPKESFFSFRTFVPPPEEQTAIADFLDRKTAQIDKAIAQKEALIERLKERRQILIHRAVTRGLNPDVRMKDSGVEWIGEVPEHWEVKRLKYIASSINEKIPSKTSSLEYIGMENVESFTGELVTSTAEVEGLANSFEPGDVLFGKLRPYLAKVHLAKQKGLCSTEFIVFRPTMIISSAYLQAILLSSGFINLVNSSTFGSKMPRASFDFISSQYIALPNKQEQFLIVQFLNNITNKTLTAIATKQTEIARLREYKSTLINAAVTGKIKVS